MKKISAVLTTESINSAIKELKAYQKSLPKKAKQLAIELAETGASEAESRFASALYAGTNDSSVEIQKTRDGAAVVASGNAVAFIEFGTGVHYNGSGSYPLPKPSGIVGIGEFGNGMGKRDMWFYHGDAGNAGAMSIDKNSDLVATHGNPAYMPMFHAMMKIEEEAYPVAKEVFGDASW